MLAYRSLESPTDSPDGYIKTVTSIPSRHLTTCALGLHHPPIWLRSAWAGRSILVLILSVTASGRAQGPPASKSADVQTATSLPTPLTLHFGDPVTFPLGSKQSALLGDFKCDGDGSIYFPMTDDVYRSGPPPVFPALMITSLRPSGSAVRYSLQAVAGYRNLISEARYFISASSVYVLATALKIDPVDNQKTIERSHLIEVFSHKGELTRTIILDPDLSPINLAAFETGEILIFSLDRLNHTTRLFLLDSAGRRESELSLFDNDFAKKLDLAAKTGVYPSKDDRALSNLLAVANLIPRGENLLLAASQANLPVLELNQHGVVRALTLALPPGTTLQSLIPSDDGLLHALVGKLHPVPSSNTASEGASPSETDLGLVPTEIDEFYPLDGSLSRRVSLEPGPIPVCDIRGSYVFLAPREADGKLQMILATPR
jgi:hypothetical protein